MERIQSFISSLTILVRQIFEKEVPRWALRCPLRNYQERAVRAFQLLNLYFDDGPTQERLTLT